MDINHNSVMYPSNNEGHQDGGSRADNKGGNQYGKPRHWGPQKTRETIITIKTNTFSHDLRLTPKDPITDIGAILNCLYMNSPSDYDQQINPIKAQIPDGNKIEAHNQCKMKMDKLT